MSIFKDNAPKHWAAGLPVMPLRPVSKIPALNSWQTYASQMPTAEEQERWLESYPDGNIGVPLGAQSGLVALDLDSEDPRALAILQKHMPPTPWIRKGKKGAVYVFKYTGERTYRIKDKDNNTIMELLSSGAQVVLPPSIHPDTQRPYEANADLVDVLHKINPLPADFELSLRKDLIAAGFELTTKGSAKLTEWVPSGGRDSAMTSIAGLNARAVIRGERSLLEALNEIDVWVATYTEKVVGDSMDNQKARQKVMEFIRRDLFEHGKMLPTMWSIGMTDEEIEEAKKFFGGDAEQWTHQQVLDHLTQRFSETEASDISSRAVIIEDALMKVGRSEQISDVQEELILKFIYNANSRMMTMGALRKQLKTYKSSEIGGLDHTEIARLLIQQMERYGKICYVHGAFVQWKGSHWEEIPLAVMYRELADCFGDLPAARRRSDHRGIVEVAAALVPQKIRTNETLGINFANGYLTTDMQLLDHSEEFGATYCLPYRYVPEMGAPVRFLALLDQSWGRDEDYAEKVQALREAIGASLFGITWRFARAFCLYGPPHSGKTTVTDIVSGLFPVEAKCSVPPQDWGDRFLPAQMAGKLMNRCGELSEKHPIAGDRFKSIVEGGQMTVQHKNRDPFLLEPHCAHWFCSNHLPKTRDMSAGFTRRWLFLQFARQVKDSEKIGDLAQTILSEEREAIATWAVAAVPDLLRRHDYTKPSSHLKVQSEMAQANNSVRFFLLSGEVRIEEGCGSIEERLLYSRYYMFCKTVANAHPVPMKVFHHIMTEMQMELGYEIATKVGNTGEEVSYLNIIPNERGKKAA